MKQKATSAATQQHYSMWQSLATKQNKKTENFTI
jgi:hypothetical protein